MEYSGGGSNGINLDDYYTKEECDDKFINKTSLDDYYTKEECDTEYLQKTGGTMSGTLNMEKAIGDYMCLYDNTGLMVGSIGNDNGNLRMYGENGNLVLQSDHDVVVTTSSGDIRLEYANVSIGSSTVHTNLIVNGETAIDSNLTVNGAVVIERELVVGDTSRFNGQVYMSDDIIVGTSGDTITLNKAFFQSILDRLTALEEKTSSL